MKDRRARILRDRAEKARRALQDAGYLIDGQNLHDTDTLVQLAAEFFADLLHLGGFDAQDFPFNKFIIATTSNHASDTEEARQT